MPTRRDRLRPNRPAMIAAQQGQQHDQQSRWVFEITIRLSPSGIDVIHVDGAAVAEQGDQDRQADGGLSAAATVGMKNTNTWPAGVAERARERDEVDVHRQQHQLQRHQQA